MYLAIATLGLLLLILSEILPDVASFSTLGGNHQQRTQHFPPVHQRITSTTSLRAVLTPTGSDFLGGAFTSLMQQSGGSNKRKGSNSYNSVDQFFQAWNTRDLKSLSNQFSYDCTFDDATYPGPFEGRDAVNRHFRILAGSTDQTFVLDNMAVGTATNNIAVLYHAEDNNIVVPNSRHCSFFTLDEETGLITSVFDTVEPSSKAGAANLALLALVGNLLEQQGGNKSTLNEMIPAEEQSLQPTAASNKLAGFFDTFFNQSPSNNKSGSKQNAAQRYFSAWNQRDMDAAIDVFSNDCQYEDTVFPVPFEGKEALKKHLYLCADSMPSTFSFVVDDMADAGDRLGVRWHVENNGEQMPFTRGCSFYTTDQSSGLILTGIDEVEPSVFKLGGVKLFVESLLTNIAKEPVRLIPLAVWLAYMYVVFFSDDILPGANALQLEQRTWEEVRDLSLNFFLVSPLLNLPFSPTVHPVLEGVFNLLLAWAALFAGFLSDDRNDKPNVFPMLPAVAGMQFLTSAFLLPYLTLRTSETMDEGANMFIEDLDKPAQLAESKLLGPLLGSVGGGSLVWAMVARTADFGGLNERMSTFWQLMSIDRVGSSFLVDLAIFAAFQGWLIDDDLRRRAVGHDEQPILRNTAKFVPFFGLAAYMLLRPSFASNSVERSE